MPDREKVIKALEYCITGDCDSCFYRQQCIKTGIKRDALALLKDDETRIQYLKDHIAMCKEEIERLHKEQEAVVRCKECKHFYKDDFGLPICMEHKKLWIKDNWFCADGELKKGR